MDHAVDTIPFCERNTKLWVTLLVVAGVLVLAYSFWLAYDRGQFSGFAGAKAAGHAAPPSLGPHGPAGPGRGAPALPVPGGPAAAAVPGPAAGAGIRVAQTRPVAAAGTAPIDGVTHATPHGGIKFIGGATAGDLQFAFNHAADVIRPSVVNVSATRSTFPIGTAPVAQGAQFIKPFDGVPDKIVGQAAYENVGSGLIVHAAGYVITNNHVIEGATSVLVSRFGKHGEHLPAVVVAADREADLAVLQIRARAGFPAAVFADSTAVEVGDWVLAVGNPFGLEHTVTAGIVSAKRSSLVVEGVEYHGLLQTDAPINRGSSGGPLVNLNGEVIGINTAIWAPSGVFSGAGFCIPSNRVRAFLNGVLQRHGGGAVVPVGGAAAGTGAAHQPYIGVGVIDVTPALAQKLSFPHQGGVYVSSVVLDSPADEAELVRGDIIVGVGGKAVTDRSSLGQLLRGLGAGSSVPMTIWRGGKTEQVRVTIAAGRAAGN